MMSPDVNERWLGEVLKNIENSVARVERKVDALEERLAEEYVTRTEFEAKLTPMQMFVYGTAGAILILFLAGVGKYIFGIGK